jgi:hypothetical protein
MRSSFRFEVAVKIDLAETLYAIALLIILLL